MKRIFGVLILVSVLISFSFTSNPGLPDGCEGHTVRYYVAKSSGYYLANADVDWTDTYPFYPTYCNYESDELVSFERYADHFPDNGLAALEITYTGTNSGYMIIQVDGVTKASKSFSTGGTYSISYRLPVCQGGGGGIESNGE